MAVAIDPDTGNLYVGAQRKIWVSVDQARTFRLYYTGKDGEDILVLAYDALVSGGPGGLQGYGGEPPKCKGNKASLISERSRKTSKRNILATIVGLLTNDKVSDESITLQKKTRGSFSDVSTKSTTSSGKLSFRVNSKLSTYRLVDTQDDVVCTVRRKSR